MSDLIIVDVIESSADLEPCPEYVERIEQTAWCDQFKGHLGFCMATLPDGRRLMWSGYLLGRTL